MRRLTLSRRWFPLSTLGALALAMLAVTLAESYGQQLRPAERSPTVQSLQPRHLSLDAAASRLEMAIRERRLAADVLVDAKSQSVLVRGAPEVLREISGIWSDLDRPSQNKPKVVFISGPGAPERGATEQAEPERRGLREERGVVRERPQPLRNVRSTDFENQFASLFKGTRFQTHGDRDVVSATLPGASGAQITIDHRGQTVALSGPEQTIASWRKIVTTLDRKLRADETTAVMAFERADPAQIRQVMQLLRTAQAADRGRPRAQFVAQQEPPAGDPLPPADARAFAQPPEGMDEGGDDFGDADDDAEEGPIGAVRIEIDPDTGMIIVSGRRRDVERVLEIIDQIERETQEARPVIEIVELRHANDQQVAALIAQIYDQVFGPRMPRVLITPLVKPNALMLIGQQAGVGSVRELIERLDQPVAPTAQFRVVSLRHVSAIDAERTLRNFFVSRPGFETTERVGLGARVNVVADYRSNALIIQASPRDMAEVMEMIRGIDKGEAETTDEVRIFRLRNTLAEELAPVLQQAVTGQAAPGTPGAPAQQPAAGPGGATPAQVTPRSTNLQLLRVDQSGRRLMESGILADVRISADARGNSLIVRGPADSMDLIAALIEQLDQPPGAEAAIKVFTLVHGDAQLLMATLQQLFGQPTG
jgi:general secretion pathway protein D